MATSSRCASPVSECVDMDNNLQFKFKSLTFEDSQTNNIINLMKKARLDCVKDGNDKRFQDLVDKVNNAVSDLSTYLCTVFPCLSSSIGTLMLQIQAGSVVEVTSVTCDRTVTLPVVPTIETMAHDDGIDSRVTCRPSDAGSRPVQPVGTESCHVPLDKLKVSPRLSTGTDSFAQIIELRRGTSSESSAIATCPETPKCDEKFHAQAVDTGTPTTPGGLFVDLKNPCRPLPSMSQMPRALVKMAISPRTNRQWLGSGGFGTVDRLECPKLAFAHKKILLRSKSILDDARSEASIMKRLQHPNIVGYYCSYIDKSDDTFNLLVEWMPGGSLKDDIKRRGPFRDKETVVRCMGELLNGLAYLHKNGIVHRDIKVDNLLFGESGELKLCDFGHARQLVDGVVPPDDRFGIDGTVIYMAPEFIASGKYTAACDIWSAGLVLYEMLTGRQPWIREGQKVVHRDELMAVYFQIGSAVSAPEIPIDVPADTDLRDLTAWCLQMDSERRPSAAELLHHSVFYGLVFSGDDAGKEDDVSEMLSVVGLDSADCSTLQDETDMVS